MRNQLIALLSSLLLASGAHCQSVFDDETTSSFKTATSAIVALTGSDNLSAGSYKIKSSSHESDDAKIDLYKIVGEFEIGPRGQEITPLIEISPSYLTFKQDLADPETSGDAEIKSWGIVTGFGVRMKFFDDLLELTPRFKAQYTELNYDFSIEGVEDSFLDQIIPDIKAWNYIPSLDLVIREPLSDSDKDRDVLLLESTLDLVYTQASSSNSNLDDFTASSQIWRNRVALEHRLQPISGLGALIVRQNLSRVDLGGAARAGFEFNNFYEVGVDLISRDTCLESSCHSDNWFKEVGIGATYIFEHEVTGWRLGIIGKLA